MIILGSRHLPVCCCLLLCLLSGCASADIIQAAVGADVTLTCKYDAQYYGRLSVCWGKGAIPNSGCANEVIRTDGTSVISRLSERYLLTGDLGEGDVSLTIRQVQESDSGTYGCRVEIPGWFNDHKHQQILYVEPAPPKPLRVETREVKERTITVRWTPGFDGGSPITSYRIDLKNKMAPWDTAVRTEGLNPELTEATLVDLRPAKSYNLRMFAINSVGMSESSNVLTITTKEAAPEGPPLDMQLESFTSHSIRVTWKPPRLDLRNGALRSYSISYREYDPGSKQFKRWQHLSVTAMREQESVTLKNLRPSTKYGVLIQAKTNAGIGPASTAPLCSTLDEVPSTSTTEAIKTTSTADATRKQKTTIFTAVHTASIVETTAATVWGQSSTTSTLVPPDPPVVELREVRDNTVSFCWTAGFDGGSPITGYDLEYKAANVSWDSTKTVLDFNPNQTEATIIEIHPSTYNIRMFARNIVGTSEASNIVTITVGETGHQRDELSTTSSTESPPTQAAVSGEESQSGRLATIVVPLVLLVLIVAIVTTWQLRRVKQKKGSLELGSESLQEL
ncbi:hypothetical protein LDENG_00294720 [Lucifuga dentata]|nr:hypothetical protein LDENG_00294720 [Lucifuga dentata]